MHEILQPEGWARPVGYSNGMAARGRLIFTGGQIGWNAQCEFETDDLLAQIGQTLANIAAILKEAGARPEHIISMTWYLTDLARISRGARAHGTCLSRGDGAAFSADGGGRGYRPRRGARQGRNPGDRRPAGLMARCCF